MEAKQEKLLPRSKSMGFLDKLDNEYNFVCFKGRYCGYSRIDNAHASVSSIEACFEYDETESSRDENKLDSGIGKNFVDGETLLMLDHKIDKLTELLNKQHSLLMCIKENVIRSKAVSQRQLTNNEDYERAQGSEDNKGTMSTNETMIVGTSCDSGPEHADKATAAQNLFDAIEKQDICLDHIIGVTLENFLQSDGLKEHVAVVTAEYMKGVLESSFCQVVSNAYLPAVERSHRRLVKHVTQQLDDCFADLEESTGSLFKSIYKTSRNIRMALEKHRNLLEAADPFNNIKLLRTTLKRVLEEELRIWRDSIVQELTSQAVWDSNCESDSPEPRYDEPPMSSPMQPANPEISAVDSLMKCAVINKHVQDGDINGAFEEALSSADLSLVMAACRAADPAACPLRPAVLLSLLQQLATDMVHDTQLKCRYLEEAILSLDKSEASTREHLPIVVEEIRKHLTKFLLSYPKHHASRRVALIVMAADNLLK